MSLRRWPSDPIASRTCCCSERSGSRAVQISGKNGFSACILWKRLRRVGAYEIKLPEDFRSTHPSAITLRGSANPHFVIPSVPGWPIQVGGGHRTACDFLYGKSHTPLRFEAANGPSGAAEGPAVLPRISCEARWRCPPQFLHSFMHPTSVPG